MRTDIARHIADTITSEFWDDQDRTAAFQRLDWVLTKNKFPEEHGSDRVRATAIVNWFVKL